jgi:hypothetical protein
LKDSATDAVGATVYTGKQENETALQLGSAFGVRRRSVDSRRSEDRRQGGRGPAEPEGVIRHGPIFEKLGAHAARQSVRLIERAKSGVLYAIIFPAFEYPP